MQDLEQVIARLNELERQRAEGWREAAHDLRGNLGVLQNICPCLIMTESPKRPCASSVHMLKSGVDWMHAFLNDLMTLSRLEAGHESRSIERFDAAALLKDLCNSMRHLSIERRLFLTAQGPDELSVEGDKVKVRRIAQNLLSNALNYTDSGGVKVEWRVDETPGTARWSLCVEDTGPGMEDGPVTPMAYALKDATDLEAATPEAQPGGEALNAPTAPTMRSQSDVRAETKSPGEGVGLSIVKRLCELLDASLELQTEPGKGTTFRVMFPLRLPRTNGTAGQNQRPADAGWPFIRCLLLLAVHYCGGLTPSLLTWTRVAVILPSAPTLAAMNAYSPGLSSERSASTAMTMGVVSGTSTCCEPPL